MSDNATTQQEEDKVEKFFAFLKQRAEDHEKQKLQKRKEKEDQRMQTRRLPYKDDE